MKYMRQSAGDAAQIFVNQFTTGVHQLMHACAFKTIYSYYDVAPTAPQSMYMPPVSDHIMEYIVNKLKKKKSPGIDGIEVADIIDGGKNLATAIKTIINQCIKQSILSKNI
jgi:hypothetical protein